MLAAKGARGEESLMVCKMKRKERERFGGRGRLNRPPANAGPQRKRKQES